MLQKTLLSLTFIGMLIQPLHAGVGQARAASSATNPYTVGNQAATAQNIYGAQNMQAVSASAIYGTVNPNYSNAPTGNTYYDSSSAESAGLGKIISDGTLIEVLPENATALTVGGARYYYDTKVFFTEVFYGGTLLYQVVAAPIGAVVTTLPEDCQVKNYNGKSFAVCGHTYYKQVDGGYQVVPKWN